MFLGVFFQASPLQIKSFKGINFCLGIYIVCVYVRLPSMSEKNLKKTTATNEIQ